MKKSAFAVALALAGLAASAALATPPPGKNKHETSTNTSTTTTTVTTNSHKGKPNVEGQGCRPSVAVILRGTLAADGAAAPTTLSVNVTGGNHASRAYRPPAAQPVSVAVTTSTRVNRRGDHNPADLKSGDRVNIHARACRADLKGGGAPALTAKRVVAHPTDPTHSTSDTSTTTSTTTTTTTSDSSGD